MPDPHVLTQLDRLDDGALVEIEAVLPGGAEGDAESLIVHRQGERVRAWLNVCPHAGRRLDWAPGRFLVGKDGLLVCAAHGAAFELEHGRCVSGPCRGESLRRVPVQVAGGEVRLLLEDIPADGERG